MTLTIEAVMRLSPVIAVLVAERVNDAVPIAKALVEGGVRTLEVTLRTSSALDVIKAMREIEGAVVGAGNQPFLLRPNAGVAHASRVCRRDSALDKIGRGTGRA
jgi:2-dehydro-3-deoxyphosphogluconate aldolase/(4S)-4-hydroxy-2-oxoglutarate aldolase